MVDERIKSMTPCIKNQIDEDFKILVDEEYSDLIHEETTCKGCTVSPIRGIRYSCVEASCAGFDLCAVCERKNIHDHHNMIKMKKIESVQQVNADFGEIGAKLIRKVLDDFRPSHTRHSANSEDDNGDREHHRHHHGRRGAPHGHKDEKHQDRRQAKVNRRV